MVMGRDPNLDLRGVAGGTATARKEEVFNVLFTCITYKDYSIWGSILGYPYFGTTTIHSLWP